VSLSIAVANGAPPAFHSWDEELQVWDQTTISSTPAALARAAFTISIISSLNLLNDVPHIEKYICDQLEACGVASNNYRVVGTFAFTMLAGTRKALKKRQRDDHLSNGVIATMVTRQVFN
jgi:hypothetical protein